MDKQTEQHRDQKQIHTCMVAWFTTQVAWQWEEAHLRVIVLGIFTEEENLGGLLI